MKIVKKEVQDMATSNLETSSYGKINFQATCRCVGWVRLPSCNMYCLVFLQSSNKHCILLIGCTVEFFKVSVYWYFSFHLWRLFKGGV